MGRELASAAARWVHLARLGVRPQLAVVCDTDPAVLAWYEQLRPEPRLVGDYRELLADESVEAVYCAVPHHLHAEICVAAIEAGKHLLAEKPVGIDLEANEAILGTAGSIAFSTKLPKTLRTMSYEPGGPQEWRVVDLGSQSAYPTISGAVFEFGFSDAIQQMWAAYLDELAHGRAGMRQRVHCATLEEAHASHRLFTAALRSQREGSVVPV